MVSSPRRWCTISMASLGVDHGCGPSMSYPQTASHSFQGRTIRRRPSPMPPTSARLHDPVQDARPMRDVAAEVGGEDDVHAARHVHLAHRGSRRPAATWLRPPSAPIRWLARIVVRVAAEAVAQRRGDAVGVLDEAEVLRCRSGSGSRARRRPRRMGSRRCCGRSTCGQGPARRFGRPRRARCRRRGAGASSSPARLVQNARLPSRSCGIACASASASMPRHPEGCPSSAG